ncbi:MAG TPA: gliding motility-associated C-terminal domain-containing protein [Puia sp.]
MLKIISLLLIALLLIFEGRTQNACTTIGQTPSTAFPVCGVDTFKQSSVPLCSSHSIDVPGCPDALAQGGYRDLNPFWYEFTCYSSGTLGFQITPNDLGDDYDWQLYDITGHNPNDVFTDSNLIVTGNWSGSSGMTGASNTGVTFIQCASDPTQGYAPTFAKMPNLIKGHTYLLLISHYTNSQSGYQLTFNGGTASITDPTIPVLQNATISCDAKTISLKLSKKVTCLSLTSNGSDFNLSSGLSSIISATGVDCDNGFDFDSLLITLNNPLPIGNYLINAKIGTDGNTLLDDCHNSVPVGDSAKFSIIPLAPTPFNNLLPVGCAPGVLQVVFSKPIQCSSISADGSDFLITGTSPVTILSASGNCNPANDLTNVILIKLSAPIVSNGTYQIKLVNGDDGNTIIDECNQQTPAGETINFTTKDTVSAQFTDQVFLGCKYDSIQFNNSGANGINQWKWTFDSTSSSLQNPLEIDSVFGNKTAQLIVSNGVCGDTASATIPLDNAFKASFLTQDSICPTDKNSFINNSTGNISSWFWDFGDGTNSTDQNPAIHSFPLTPNEEKLYTVFLIAGNALGCFDTATVVVTKLRSCYITVPNAFTPNGDGHNDYLYPLNALKAINLEFRVYNRYGQLVFETRDWLKKWDGTVNGKPQDTGTYVWMLQYTDGETGKKYFLKGTSVLIR